MREFGSIMAGILKVFPGLSGAFNDMSSLVGSSCAQLPYASVIACPKNEYTSSLASEIKFTFSVNSCAALGAALPESSIVYLSSLFLTLVASISYEERDRN